MRVIEWWSIGSIGALPIQENHIAENRNWIKYNPKLINAKLIVSLIYSRLWLPAGSKTIIQQAKTDETYAKILT
jgi:hypothetical protein